MKVQVSQIIDRPVATVFRFYAHEHVRNHPRWDPMMELEQVTDGPIGLGTVIRRRNLHQGEPISGTMEIVEFEEDRAMGALIHDGPSETKGRAVFERIGADQTRLIISADMPWLDESADVEAVEAAVRQSVENIKRLIESET